MYTEEKLKELQALSLEDKLVYRVNIAPNRSNKLSKLLRKEGLV